MGRNKTRLLAGIAFLLGAGLFAVSIARDGMQSHLLTGTILCALIGIGFLRNSKDN